MAAFGFNVAKGRVAEFAYRINANDPANSAFVLVALVSTQTAAVLKDFDTLADVIADTRTDEATNSGYARIVLTDASSITVRADDTADTNVVDAPDQTFRAVRAGDNWTHLLLGYDSDTTGGTDANIVPCDCYDFVVNPNGGDIVVGFNASGAFVAS